MALILSVSRRLSKRRPPLFALWHFKLLSVLKWRRTCRQRRGRMKRWRKLVSATLSAPLPRGNAERKKVSTFEKFRPPTKISISCWKKSETRGWLKQTKIVKADGFIRFQRDQLLGPRPAFFFFLRPESRESRVSQKRRRNKTSFIYLWLAYY